ncbi:hypothetical protein Pan216_16260 [Planctomycetes bacterium Pan216]|uniref:Sulfatase n=1 Tax=Kolteria novifilia TaxID=2527975 RepID=A0A518B1B8_9BACT|nr:hypothetical protein Pan216_16260 [Planctomycetes bacterium Pan216]
MLDRRTFLAASASAVVGAPLSARASIAHHPASAKHVIFLYMTGAYSHVDTFDPKPRLIRDHDQAIGEGTEPDSGTAKRQQRILKAPLWKFRPNRHCGTEISDLFPHLREQMHHVALIRSMHADHNQHGEATLQIHTGSTATTMPGIGAWLSYALGTDNPNLPGHVVIAPELPYKATQPFDSSFLPPRHRGLRVVPGSKPIEHLSPITSADRQERELDLLRWINVRHLKRRGGADQQLAGRMETFEAAHGLQRTAPEVLDLTKESKATRNLYGIEEGDTTSYGAQCIMARRLIENGVRFVEIVDSVGNCQDNWDTAHRSMDLHADYAKIVDQPVAALIQDLQQRGLWDETLLVFCTEFGRTPWNQDGKPGAKNRAHHKSAFSCWLAGGGVRGGVVHGETDDIGNEIVANPVHVHDYHATILHLLGLDHEKLTYRYGGRDFRLTDVHGHVVKEILA